MLLSKRLVVIYKDDVGNRTDAYNTGGQPNINSIDLTWQRWPPPTSVPLEPFLHRHFAHTSSRGRNFRQTCEIPQPRNFSKPISSTLSTSMESSTVKSKLSFFLSFTINLLNSKSLEQGKTIKESMKIFIAFLLWDIIREEWIEHWNILKKIKMHRNWISLTSLTFIERKWKTIEFVWNSHRHHRDPPLFASFSP